MNQNVWPLVKVRVSIMLKPVNNIIAQQLEEDKAISY